MAPHLLFLLLASAQPVVTTLVATEAPLSRTLTLNEGGPNGWPVKAPDSALNYTVNWTDLLYGAETLTTVTAEVDEVSGLVLEAHVFTAGRSDLILSGGTAGEVGTITFTLTGSGGLSEIRTMQVVIAEAPVSYNPSTGTKQALVEMAYEEMTLTGYEFDHSPQEYATGLRRLDALMGEWRIKSLDLGYNFPAVIGQSSLHDPAGIPDATFNTVALALAQRLMPTIGKTMSAETRVALAEGMTALRAAYAKRVEYQIPGNVPLGSGHRLFRYPGQFTSRAR